MKFRARIDRNGKTATGFEVPPHVVESLGAGKRPPVRVTINGSSYRSTVASRGGRYMVGVSAANRELTGVDAGDDVEIQLELDTAPREVEVPDDLAVALDADPAAGRFFDTLSYSQKQWYTLPISGAKKAETRERRVAKAIEMLREGRKR